MFVSNDEGWVRRTLNVLSEALSILLGDLSTSIILFLSRVSELWFVVYSRSFCLDGVPFSFAVTFPSTSNCLS